MLPTITDRVAWSVDLSVHLSLTVVSRAKTAEPIKMSFGLWTRVGPRNHVLIWGPDTQCEWAILRRKGRFIVKYGGLSAVSCAKTGEPMEV